jgi:hypothetical protein
MMNIGDGVLQLQINLYGVIMALSEYFHYYKILLFVILGAIFIKIGIVKQNEFIDRLNEIADEEVTRRKWKIY